MKKILMLFLSIVFMSVVSLAAMNERHINKDCGGKKYMTKDGAEHCSMMALDADVSVKNTKNGAVITIKSKKGGSDAKTIQERAKMYVENCRMYAGKKATAGDDEAVCPVMGTKIKKSKAHSKWKYKGETYYFCCAGCPDAFKKDPEKYLKKQDR